MSTYGCAIPVRNDNYGFFLFERTLYSLNSAMRSYDEVVVVDWATPLNKPTMVEEVSHLLQKTGCKLSCVRVYPEQAREWTHDDPEAQACVEVMARNIGIRRLNTDFRVSTNIDIIQPKRFHLEKVNDARTFVTTGKRSISLFPLWELGRPWDIDSAIRELEKREKEYGQQPAISICPGDTCSLVSGCGDFQAAHKDIWYTIRGFEERLYKRAYADSNVQRKAQIFGFETKIDWSIPVWHVGHEGGMGGKGGYNDMNLAIFMAETTNPETWGFSEEDLEVTTYA